MYVSPFSQLHVVKTTTPTMATNGSYSGNEKISGVSEIEYATDPASGGFFHSDYKKHDDLKQMLDVNKDSMKLEAMKRIIGMIAKGRDASGLFPAVVKNVVSKNIEVKKLVYVYLVRYAEEQQDLALLSISTFQRALKDPNQLIRGSALRVLSSIRVTMIVPIVMLAIKDAAADMSPYVRKTAAHAIPKLYNLDPDQKEELILVIDKLLSDRTTLVVGSAVMAFEEVCPERIDLIHKNFRKLCNLLVDVDEWGQVIIVNMLTRYARTQFTDPNINEADEESENNKSFYENDSGSEAETEPKKKTYILDPDHKLLLRSARPLLQSRNAAVVMSVAQLYHHLAPKSDVTVMAKSLIRLLRSHREVQSVVLNCIASISIIRKEIFESFLKSFFVRTSDPTHIKILKLEILTSLATESNISIILREFQTYISSVDKQFVAATVHAIGRCASDIKEVRDSCLNGLVTMLSNRDEAVVAESVVVIKKLLQTHPNAHTDIIKHMARLVDNITVPQARASILWLLGEYSHLVPKLAPDVLRKMAKSFVNEEDIVKLQILNLAVKLFLTNESQTKLLCQYVLTLARYDQNYDIRDRSRLLRQVLFPQNEDNKITAKAKDIFLANKPAPLLVSKFIDREEFQMGSLSHYINARANGYHDLPSFPEVQPDTSARNVPTENTPKVAKKQISINKKKSFYSDSDNTSSPDEDSDDSDDSEESGEDSSEPVSDDSENSEKPSYEFKKTKAKKSDSQKSKQDSSDDDEEEDSDESDDSDESEEESSDEESEPEPRKPVKKPTKQVNKRETKAAQPQKSSNIDLLLELDNFAPTPVMTPSSFLSPMTPASNSATSGSAIQFVGAVYVSDKSWELLNKINSSGQLSIQGRFTRSPHIYSSAMVSIELILVNHHSDALTNIRVGQKNLGTNISMHEFPPVASLMPTEKRTVTLGVNFNDSTQPISFEVLWNCDEVAMKSTISFKAPVGELLRAVSMPESNYLEEQTKLKGMNEHSANITIGTDDKSKISQYIYEVANFASTSSIESSTLRYSAQTLASQSLVLLTVVLKENREISITVNCEKMVVGSMVLNEVKNNLLKLA
ncbi:AP-3 complex subunit beta-1 [Planococcus citri]|uniref:AP-3 complex subunit beta-1 n=1 Tax=Planococcus citri TaxID=170843 RepID=UPI0031F9D8C7